MQKNKNKYNVYILSSLTKIIISMKHLDRGIFKDRSFSINLIFFFCLCLFSSPRLVDALQNRTLRFLVMWQVHVSK